MTATPRKLLRLLLPALALLLGVGCAKSVDRFTIDRVFARAAVQPDVGRGCAVGLALGYPMEAIPKAKNTPARGVVMADAAAALCDEDLVREAQLEGARVEANLDELAPAAQIAMIKDAREVEARAHARAARRYLRAWGAMQEAWGPVGEGECPRLKEKDEIAWVMGLNAGLNGLLHDRAAGGVYGVPLDTLLKVARGSECVDDARWWHVPTAMRAAAWATVPGSAPEGVEPWALLEEAASSGDDAGVRLARAIQVVIAANNGRPDVVASGIRAFAESVAATPTHPDYALFDDYARVLVRHESDLLWTRAVGHRTLELGALPGDAAEEQAAGPDPFGADPFANPFAGTAEGSAPQTPPSEAPEEDER